MRILRIVSIGAVLLASTSLLLSAPPSSEEAKWSYDSRNASLAAPGTTSAVIAREVAAFVDQAVQAYNEHNIPAYLATYWRSPNLISIANDDEIFGYDALATEVVSAFKDPTTMGQMRLDRLKIKVISSDTAYCVADYVVDTSLHHDYCGDTELLKRFPIGWRIVFERADIRKR